MHRNELDRITEDRNLWWAAFWHNLKWILRTGAVIGFLVSLKFLQQLNSPH
jgi:hypothetical protein